MLFETYSKLKYKMVRTKQTSKSTKQGGVSNKAGRKIISNKRVASKPAL
jgi:hypothetical protein